jgi:hypothetical protein
MNHIATIEAASLPSMVQHAATQLAHATSAAEVLEAKETASAGYDAAKRTARFAKAKGAHDELISNIHRRQADFLEIEAMAKRRLADEYDAAQDRGEIRAPNQGRSTSALEAPSVAEIGLTHKDIHEARQFRDAERNEPGIARRALDARLAQGLEPNKAALREAVMEAAKQGLRGGGAQTPSNRNPLYEAPTQAGAAWSHAYGTCRAFAEWASEENLRLASQGRFERRDDQTRNVAAVRRALEALADLERMIDAH